MYLVLRVNEGVSRPWWHYLPGLKLEAVIGSGPLWFVGTLLIFSVVYVGALKRFQGGASFRPRTAILSGTKC